MDLIGALDDDDPKVRAAAARGLWNYEDPEVVEALTDAAGDAEPAVRAAALMSLKFAMDRKAASSFTGQLIPSGPDLWKPRIRSQAGTKYPRAVETIAAAREDTSGEVRWAAAVTLGALDDPRAVEALIECLYKPPEPFHERRGEAIQALGAIGDPRGAEAMAAIYARVDDLEQRRAMVFETRRIEGPASLDLLALAAKDGDETIRLQAGQFLVDKGGERALEILKTMAEDVSPKVRDLVLREIGPAPEPPPFDELLSKLEDSDPSVRVGAADALGEMGDARAVEPLLAATKDGYIQVRRVALQSLVKVEGGDRTFERAVALLSEEEPPTRRYIVTALGELGDPRSIEVLGKCLEEPDMNVRRDAVSALARFEDDRAVDLLLEAANDPEEYVRGMAVFLLIERKEPRAEATLIRLLKSQEPYEAIRAASGLGMIGGPDAVEPLLDVLQNHPDVWHTRPPAARALGKIGDPRAFRPLAAALGHECSRLRSGAALGLADLGDDRAVELLVRRLVGLEEIQVRVALAEALEKFDRGKVTNEFLEEFKTSDWFARYAGAGADGPGGDFFAGVMVAALADPDPTVRLYGVLGLTAVHETGAVHALIGVLDDDNFSLRFAAANALGELGDPRAGEALIPLLCDPEYSVRLRATWSLQKIGDESLTGPLIDVLREKPDECRSQAMDVLRRITRVPFLNDPGSWIRWWDEKQSGQAVQGRSARTGE